MTTVRIQFSRGVSNYDIVKAIPEGTTWGSPVGISKWELALIDRVVDELKAALTTEGEK